MDWQGWFTIGIVALVFLALVKEIGAPDLILLAGSLMLALAGVITTKDLFSGFSNDGMLTVAALFVVVTALRETGALDIMGRQIMKADNPKAVLRRMAVFLTVFSAVLNNTPIVAMMLPVVTDWCRKHRVSPSKLLIPLSFITVLGGVCSMIGTSTNLVMRGLMSDAAKTAEGPMKVALTPPAIFEITPLGIACAAVGIFYLLTWGVRLLPDRRDLLEQMHESARDYLVAMLIEPGCRLSGKTVAESGLRALPGLFLVELTRGTESIAPVTPDQILHEGDQLTFSGVVTSVVDLERIPGLVPVADEAYEADPAKRRARSLSEAVISPSSPLIGRTIRGADFRALYNAAIVAVHRGGERLQGRIGDIVLRTGDTLLLQTGAHFARAHRNNPDFILVSGVEESRPLRHDRAVISLVLLGLLLVLMITEVIDVSLSAFAIAALMIATRCLSTSAARESINWQTLIAIAASFGLGKALDKSGAAEVIAGFVVKYAGTMGPIAVLATIYLVTMIFTELLSNNAAAVLMFPFGLAVAHQMGISPRPFCVAIMFAASLAFATPIGYQTNLMVYGPGGYKFSDFTRIGLPLNIILWVICVALIPILWPFALK